MSRRSQTRQKFPKIDATLVDGLFARDPSRGAYGEWMVRRVAEGEHHETVLEAVLTWHGCKERMPKDQCDLYQYADTHALCDAVDAIGEVSKRTKRRKSPGYTLVHEYPRITFYRIDAYAGIKTLGRDTKWCVTNEGDYKSYQGRTLVVAMSRLRAARDPYSKFAILSGEPINVDPNKFFDWETLKARARRGFRIGWKAWDAADRNPYRYGTELAPLQEIMDMLAGRRGATADAILEAVGGPTKVEAWTEVLRDLRGRVTSSVATGAAERAVRYGLFNPLSMLDHPNMRSTKACEAVWALSTRKHRESVSREGLRQLARRPAMNVPEILETYWRSVGRGGLSQPAEDIEPLIKNGLLSVAAKERVAQMFREDVMKLPKVG